MLTLFAVPAILGAIPLAGRLARTTLHLRRRRRLRR
jgi:type II secretory pathway component HofQ